MTDGILKPASKKHLWLPVLLVLIGIGLVCFSLLEFNKDPEAPTSEFIASEEMAVVGPVLPNSLPTRLIIPKIDLNTTFAEPVGLETNGEVAVPDDFEKVGWYKHGPTPGELGPAVVLGHVDSYQGPAVFYSLGQLELGDDIYIEREDGVTAKFKVIALERPSQSAFPTTKVYGNINHAGLRLITCSGTFERGKQRYTHNLVVYAELVE